MLETKKRVADRDSFIRSQSRNARVAFYHFLMIRSALLFVYLDERVYERIMRERTRSSSGSEKRNKKIARKR